MSSEQLGLQVNVDRDRDVIAGEPGRLLLERSDTLLSEREQRIAAQEPAIRAPRRSRTCTPGRQLDGDIVGIAYLEWRLRRLERRRPHAGRQQQCFTTR